MGGAHGVLANVGEGTDKFLPVAGELGKVHFHKEVKIARNFRPVNEGGSSLKRPGWMRPAGKMPPALSEIHYQLNPFRKDLNFTYWGKLGTFPRERRFSFL